MGESKDKLIRAIRHYQDSLERHTKTGNIEKLLHAIEKLGMLPIKVCHLEETGVGRTVNGLKRFEGSVGENARTLVDQWKSMVKGEEEEEQARIDREQQLAVNEENDMVEDERDPESLQIIDQENIRSQETSHSSLKKSSSSNKSSHSNSRPSGSDTSKSRDKKRHSSDNSDSDNRFKKQKSDKSDKKYKESESDSDSDDSESSREASPRGTKNKSRRLSSESSDQTSSDSEESSSEESSVSKQNKTKNSKKRDSSASESEEKNRKHKKSGSESDSKSKEKYHSTKSQDKSKAQRAKSRDKSDRESSTKRDSSSSKGKSKSHSNSKSKKSGGSDDKKKEESRKDSSKTHKDSQDKKRSRESSADRNVKRYKGESSKSETKKDKGGKDKQDNETQKNKKSASDSKEKDKPKTTKKLLEGIDSGSGTSFADALGMLGAPVYSKSKKKTTAPEEKPSHTSKEKTSKSRSSGEGSSSANDNEEVPKLLKDSGNLEPLDLNISSLLPSITPNYRPLGMPLDGPNRKAWTDDEALSRVISAKHQRTKVYSGNKSGYTKVPSLFELCSRILQDNLDALEYTGGVPYSILKHILERANPDQLYQLEFHNPYLIEDTDELWQLHCQKEFRNKRREELESWREMYMRCLDEREAKLKALTANIKQSQDKSLPVRQTKLAYVDSVVKPPRNIARKQAKNGTAVDLKRPSQTPAERLNQLAKAGEASKVAVPNPGRVAVDRGSSNISSHNSHIKPKKAPLMAKTLSLLKNRFGRR